MNLTGLTLGIFMLFCIGFGFFWVIKLEYYWGAQVWKLVLLAGLILCLASLFMPAFALSAIFGILGGSVIWGATEFPAQSERVQRGLFPPNPRRSSGEGSSELGNSPNKRDGDGEPANPASKGER